MIRTDLSTLYYKIFDYCDSNRFKEQITLAGAAPIAYLAWIHDHSTNSCASSDVDFK